MKSIYILLVTILVVSCSAEQRLARILKNNPELEKTEYITETIRVVDRIVNDSIIYKDSIITKEIHTIETPPTRYEIRYKYKTDKQREKTIRDSLDNIIKQLRIEKRKDVKIKKQETKQVKSDNKTERSKWRTIPIMLFLVVVVITLFIWLYNKLKQRDN